VLFFEQHDDGSYRQPHEYPAQSIASASTHDLPTLAGFWGFKDLSLGHKLGLYKESVLIPLLGQRDKQKQALLDALHQMNTLPARQSFVASRVSFTPVLNRGFHRYLAQTNSALLGLQPEDWLAMSSPVNVPGTVNEYPNWRRKLSVTLEEMFRGKVPGLLTAVNTGRRKR
jgi:4-alpha-glucanotransferase